MPDTRILSVDEVLRLPPMLFGRVRWRKTLGAPVGDPCSGFRILVEEHTATQFRMGPGGKPEPIPGTGIWKAPQPAECWAAPDEGDLHVVRFNARDVHLNAFPDGKYRVTVHLTGNWADSSHTDAPIVQRLQGFKRIEPMAYYLTLTQSKHIQSVDFEVVRDLSIVRLFS